MNFNMLSFRGYLFTYGKNKTNEQKKQLKIRRRQTGKDRGPEAQWGLRVKRETLESFSLDLNPSSATIGL